MDRDSTSAEASSTAPPASRSEGGPAARRATEGEARARRVAEATITPYRNGPYIVRGDFTILDQEGNEIERSRGTIALCRCGHSQSKPFCDGTHKVAGFEASSGPDPTRPTSEP